MRYILYGLIAFCMGILFAPGREGEGIRNVALFAILLLFVSLWICYRFFKYVSMMWQAKKLLAQAKERDLKIKMRPWESFFHGHYSISFESGRKNVQMIFMSKKKKYPRYHFESINQLEFYATVRYTFANPYRWRQPSFGTTETKYIGKRKIKWNDSADIHVILFDKLPLQITDSVKRENLVIGDKICGSNTYLLDWTAFLKYLGKTE